MNEKNFRQILKNNDLDCKKVEPILEFIKKIFDYHNIQLSLHKERILEKIINKIVNNKASQEDFEFFNEFSFVLNDKNNLTFAKLSKKVKEQSAIKLQQNNQQKTTLNIDKKNQSAKFKNKFFGYKLLKKIDSKRKIQIPEIVLN